tara:strand:+ start:1246 stop:1680 length:435 start_codon:yes stop_codon:yes gene_type:complete
VKKLLLILLALQIIFTGCEKKEESNSSLNSSIYSGTYIGDIDTYINGVFHSNVSKTITLSELNTVNNYLMNNNIFMSTTCEISNGNINIPNDTTAANAINNVIEYEIGTFNGNYLTIDFNQESIDVNTGNIIRSGGWPGTLEKQ